MRVSRQSFRRGWAFVAAGALLVTFATGLVRPPGAAAIGASGVGAAAAASGCSGHASNTVPPPSILVYRVSLGRIDRVPFQEYVDNVLPNEWVSAWHPASLQAGAMAVKSFAWYWTNHSAGNSFNGSCYDVTDTTSYQVYRPGSAVASTNAAVAATWSMRMTRGGTIMESHYCSTETACGAWVDGDWMSQYGSNDLAGQGSNYASILHHYYSGAVIDMITPSSGAALFEGGDYHVFGTSPSGDLVQDTWNGGWTGWQNLGGTVTGAPAVTYRDARFDVFAVSPNGGMYQKHWIAGAGWSGWNEVGDGSGVFGQGTGVTAVYENGAYHVFGVAPGGALFQNTWDGSWSGWQNLGGTISGTPAVTYHDGRFDVFVISPNGHMYQKYWTSGSGWSTWSHVDDGSGVFGSDTGVAAIYENGDYHVFGISPGGSLFQDTLSGSTWSGWQNLRGTLSGTPSVTYHDGRFDVFAHDGSGTAFQKWWTSGNGWSSWHGLGGNIAN